MIIRPKLRLPLLAAALAASVASAWGTYEAADPAMGNSSYVPGPAVVADEPAAPVTEAPAAETPAIATPQPVAVPAPEARPEPSITITKPRLTEDQRIQADVMDVLLRTPNLSGKIGVVSEDSVVTLTGYTATSGQAWRAGRDARGVPGVRHVVNEIRPRVGAITS